ncbi:MAG: xanthine dehydrogenase family protein subunit M [Acidobacteria bacterium]|nr:xanthine dehydrogenase family protein subunit M [Acidobacteriota bacterium]
MYPRPFEYFSPQTLDEAVALLSQLGEAAKVLAGGQSLIPLMKLRMSSPRYLVDINRIGGLSRVAQRNGAMIFGTLARHVEIEDSIAIKSKLPIMHDTASVIGDTQVRNLGTIGGALAHADPAGDWPPTLLALNAKVKCCGPKGERTLSTDELLVDAYSTNLSASEVLTEISVPLPWAGSGGAYLKFERKAGDFAVASVAVQIALDNGETCRDIGVGLGAVGLTAIRARKAESLLRGKKLSKALIQDAAKQISAEADPFSDIRGTADYKRHLVTVLFERAMNVAMRRAHGEEVETVHV